MVGNRYHTYYAHPDEDEYNYSGNREYMDVQTTYTLPGGHQEHGYVEDRPYYASATESEDSGPDEDVYYVHREVAPAVHHAQRTYDEPRLE